MTNERPQIEVLSFAGCPNAEPAADLVARVISELGIDANVERIDVESDDQVKELRFLGSPSIRVNGHDIEPGADERGEYVYSCRVYPSESGLTGQPNEHWLRAALQHRG